MTTGEKRSVGILRECIDLQLAKSKDYQNASSPVRQADYYINGVSTIYDIMHAKMLRIRSVQEAMKNDPEYSENFESLQDSVKDLINYASFYAAYLDCQIDGQVLNRDIFNRPIERKLASGKTGGETLLG